MAPRRRREFVAVTQERAAGALGHLVESLGLTILEIVAAPKGLAAPVADVLVHDVEYPINVHPGDVVLVPGGGERDLKALIEEAGHHGAAGIVAKIPVARREAFGEQAGAAGVALLALASEVEWGHAYALIRTALASAPTPDAAEHGGELGDLFALANAVASMCGGPVVLHDPQFRLIAYSTSDETVDALRRDSILGRRVPRDWIARFREEGLVKRLFAGELVHVGPPHHEGLRHRIAVAVRAGNDVLGTIWVLEDATPLDEGAEAALRQAAAISALHLIRHRAGTDLRRQARGELLSGLLEGRGAPDVLADRLDLPADVGFVVAGFELDAGDGEDAELALSSERLLALLGTYGDALRLRTAQVVLDEVAYVLVPLPDHGDRAVAVRRVRELHHQAATALKAPLRAGVGRTVATVAGIPESRTDADRVLRIQRRGGHDGVTPVEDLGEDVVLLMLEELARAHPELCTGRIATLARQDLAKGSEFILTLRALFDHNLNTKAAARAIQVHPNTFRYRLRRMREMVGLDLDDADQRFVAELQVRLVEHRRAEPLA